MGSRFNVEKLVFNLSATLFGFRVLFTRWSNRQKSVYEIPGISAKAMSLTIEYAYTGVVLVTADNDQNLLIAADYLNITGIVRQCCEFLKYHLSLENCTSIWELINTCHCPHVLEATQLFILQHLKEITSTVRGSSRALHQWAKAHHWDAQVQCRARRWEGTLKGRSWFLRYYLDDRVYRVWLLTNWNNAKGFLSSVRIHQCRSTRNIKYPVLAGINL